MKQWKSVFDSHPNATEIYVVDGMPFLTSSHAASHSNSTGKPVETVTRAQALAETAKPDAGAEGGKAKTGSEGGEAKTGAEGGEAKTGSEGGEAKTGAETGKADPGAEGGEAKTVKGKKGK